MALLCAYWMILLTATHWPNLRVPVEVPGKDKTEHVLAYGLLTALILNVAVRRFARYGRLTIVLGTLVLIAIAGALDEQTQPYFHRSCDLYDWLADMLGTGLVCLGYLAVTWGWPVRHTASGAERGACSIRSRQRHGAG